MQQSDDRWRHPAPRPEYADEEQESEAPPVVKDEEHEWGKPATVPKLKGTRLTDKPPPWIARLSYGADDNHEAEGVWTGAKGEATSMRSALQESASRADDPEEHASLATRVISGLRGGH